MCELLRFGLIRELQLSTNHFHCNTEGSTKLDYDKCILISMECSLNERLGSCVQRPTSHVHGPHWRHMGHCEERHFYKRTCTHASDTACQHVDDTFPHAQFSSFVTCMRCGLDVCPLIGATAISKKIFATEETATLRVVHKETADFRSTSVFHVAATPKL